MGSITFNQVGDYVQVFDDGTFVGQPQLDNIIFFEDTSGNMVMVDRERTIFRESLANLASLTGATVAAKAAFFASSYQNNITITTDTPKSAFGEAMTVPITPIFQGDFFYNINPDVYEELVKVGSATVTSTNSMAVLSSGTTKASDMVLVSKDPGKYRPGQGLEARFTAVFTTGVADTEQQIGMGNTSNDYLSIGYNGETFSILYQSFGSTDWIANTSFDDDIINGTGASGITIDPTKGNVYKIEFQFLGFGALNFYVENPSTGDFVRFHQIKYANLNTSPSLQNPTMFMYARTANGTTTSDIILKTASWMMAVQGERKILGPPRSESATNTSVGTSFEPIISFRVKSTFAGATNLSKIIAHSLTYASSGNQTGSIALFYNPTLTGASWADVETDVSIVEFDTSATAYSAEGRKRYTVAVGKNDANIQKIHEEDFELSPGDIWSIGGISSSGTLEITGGLNWHEDI